jgi:PAS domain S-box-containing protein
MNPGYPLVGTRNRVAVIAGLTALALGGNLVGLFLGAPEGLLPLPALPLAIPIILASYWYPRRGVIFSAGVAALYAVTVFLLSPAVPLLAYTILPRAVFLVLVGWVVALLATRLRESEQQMNEIIEFLPDATFAVDREGRIIAWNRAMEEMTGVAEEAMLGRGDREYAVPFYGERRPLLVDRVLQGEGGGGVLTEEAAVTRLRGGKGAHLRFTAPALLAAKGNVREPSPSAT